MSRIHSLPHMLLMLLVAAISCLAGPDLESPKSGGDAALRIVSE